MAPNGVDVLFARMLVPQHAQAVQLDRVRAAAPAEAARLFLRKMITHHVGAVTMARSVLEVGANAYIRTLAKHIVNEQDAENDVMRALLTTPPPG